ncbi:MAG: preprotein translocase subunit SecE [Bacilli bacterium]|nr:preprotein translocase subunit SecE [Bacilli bacterium]
MNKIGKYFRGVAEEAKRVRWPDSKLLWKSVAIVLTITIVTALSITLFDWMAIQINRAFDIAFPKDSSSASNTAAAMLFHLIGGKF